MRRFLPIILPFFLAAPAYGWLVVEFGRLPAERIAAPLEFMLPEEREAIKENQRQIVLRAFKECKRIVPEKRVIDCMAKRIDWHYGAKRKLKG